MVEEQPAHQVDSARLRTNAIALSSSRMSAMRSPRVVSVLPLEGGVELDAYSVDERLSSHVASYWTLTVTRAPARVRVIPDGCVDLVFDLDRAQAQVGGVVDAPFEAVHDRATRLLGATLLPGAGAPLLGSSVAELAVAWQELSGVIGPIADTLALELTQPQSTLERIARVETFLLARLGRIDTRVDHAVRAITIADGRVDIDQVGKRSGASARNLSRLFLEYVGIPPKRFARIVRAQAALRRLAESPLPDLGMLASELGFADQAHMTCARSARSQGRPPPHWPKRSKRKADSLKRQRPPRA